MAAPKKASKDLSVRLKSLKGRAKKVFGEKASMWATFFALFDSRMDTRTHLTRIRSRWKGYRPPTQADQWWIESMENILDLIALHKS